MIGHGNDSRIVLLALAVDGVEAATGAVLKAMWTRLSREGRLALALRRLERNGWVTRGAEGPLDERLFRLTEAGRKVLAGPVDVEQRWARAWDGKWRLVLFDVPQKHTALRTRLRRKLRERRFGWLQNSVWLSPDPIDELKQQFDQHGKSVESLVFLEARPVGGESDEELVTGAWDFGQLAKSHAAYLQVLRLRPARARQTDPDAWVSWVQTEQRAWAKVVEQDPFLPEVLWPAGYAGRSVWNARREALASCSEALARLATTG